MKDLLKRLDELILIIAGSCPKTAIILRDLAKRAAACSCAADSSKKDSIFEDFEKALDDAENDCPARKKEIDEIRDLVDQAKNVKCSGG